MSEEKNVNIQEKKKTVIGFGKLFNDIYKHRNLYYKVLSSTFVLALVYGFSLPKTYRCEVLLAPELTRTSSSSSILSLASSFGIKLGGNGAGGGEALMPTLYPDLMNSVDFKTSLFSVPVTIEGNKKRDEPDRTMTYYEYLTNERKKPWWSSVIGAPFTLFRWIGESLSGKEEKEDKKEVDPFRLTKKQTNIAKIIDNNIRCDVDPKTLVITIKVKDQNPVICATMADTVKNRLQDFITSYRTSKARVDLEYNQKLYHETKARYEKARQRYAEFADANQDIILQTVRQKQTDLENEMQLQYNAYTQVAAQLLAAEAKVQQETPAFTTLQSATVPVKKSAPSNGKICILFLFLASIITTVWVFYKEDDLKPLLGIS